jgi:hypothetical protein
LKNSFFAKLKIIQFGEPPGRRTFFQAFFQASPLTSDEHIKKGLYS